MRSLGIRIRQRLVPGVLLVCLVTLGGSASSRAPQDDAAFRAEVRRELAEMRARLDAQQSEIDQLKGMLMAFKGDGGSSTPAAPTEAPATHIRVIGNSERALYSGPNAVIVGRAEPGAVLSVARTITVGRIIWYQGLLESGRMHTLGTSDQSPQPLTAGWLPSSEVEIVK